MAGFDVSGIGGNQPGPSGLLMGLDPAYQAKQADALAAQLALKRATAFQNGVPTNPDGSIDIDTIGRTQIQNGDAAGGLGLLMTGQKLALLRDPSTISNPTGQGGGAGAGGSLLAGLNGAQPAAGGGAIAPSAGGDDYGRAPSGGYGGTGQVGVGGPGGVAPRGAAPAGGQGGAAGGGNFDQLDVFAHSIGSLESGNRYDALGPKQANGSQAVGRFQVMSSNIGPWTKEVLGTAMSPEDFRNSPEAQDAVFRAKFGQAVDKYGSPIDAASVWFSGRPLNRAGNATDSLGTTVPAYIQRFAAGLGPAVQALRGGAGGQGAPVPSGGQGQAGGAAPQGGPAAPISFNAPGLSPPDVGSTSSAPVGDSEVMAARRLVAQSQDADPRSMTLDQQRAVSAATDSIARYQDQQAQPAASAGTTNGVPTTSDTKPPSGQHPFAPGSNAVTGIRSPLAATMPPGGVQPVTVGAQPGGPQGTGGVQPISFGGAPAGGGAVPASPQAPVAPGRQPPQAGDAAPLGAMPPEVAAALTRLQNRQGSPADGATWSAYTRSVGQGVADAVGGNRAAGEVARQAMKDTAGPPGNVQGMQILASAIPSPSVSPDGVKGVSAFQLGASDYQNARKQAPDVNAFTANVTPATMVLRRLQQDQPAVFATTVAQLQQSPAGQSVLDAASRGMQFLATSGGGAGGQGGQGLAAPMRSVQATPTGPDLPYLQGQYAAPGGGAQYVSDLLDKARRYGLAGEQQAAQAFETRAKQVQDDLAAINKSRLDLQTHNAELTPEQKLFQTAVGQGFTGGYIDFQNALASGKAGAREKARLQADTDPSRLPFAQSEAAARAAGTAQGAAPYKFVPTQPTPGGPTVYTSEADLAGGNAVKDQPAVFGQKQEALGKLDGEMQGQYQQRQVAQERLDAMANLLETFQSGAGADAKAAAVAAVRAAGFNIPDSATANPAAVEQFSKNATANVFSNAKDMGGRVLVSELEGLQKANANPNMQPASNAAILAQQKGLLNWEDQHYQDYSTWRQANPYATDASSFETAWAKAHPVGAYVAAAKKDIAPLGAPLPAQGQLSDGQAYIVKGQKVRWDAGSAAFVPFSGSTAPTLPGQGSQGTGRGQAQAQGHGQGQGRGQAPPVAGARQAPDGNWYISDPGRPGKFMMVAR